MMKEYWKVKKLGEVCEVINGFAFKSTLFKDDGEPILRISNIQNGIITLENVVYFEKKDYKVKLDKYKVYPNDILIALSGATTGKVGVNRTNLELYLNQRVALCREKEFHLRGYLYYFLQTKTKELLSLAGGVAQPNLSTEQIKNLDIYSPSLDEQFRIVEELDLLSNIIEKKHKQLSELDNLAQSIFYDMFGDPVTNEKGFPLCTVGDIYKFQYGKGNKIPENKGEYLCYGSNGVVGYHTNYNSEDSPIIGHIGAYAGIVNWGKGKHFVTYNGVICKLKDDRFNPIYGYYMLKNQNYMEKVRGGAAQPFVSYDLLESPQAVIPPLDLQQLFAQKIETIEKQKALIKQSIAETEELFNSRMDYYFS